MVVFLVHIHRDTPPNSVLLYIRFLREVRFAIIGRVGVLSTGFSLNLYELRQLDLLEGDTLHRPSIPSLNR